MSDRTIEKGQWSVFCDRISRQLKGARAEIEVASLGVGDQIQAEWVPLLGVAYDPKDDLFEIALDGLDHVVRRPTSLAANWVGTHVVSLAVVGGEGERHLVRFREPLRLPAPEHGSK